MNTQKRKRLHAVMEKIETLATQPISKELAVKNLRECAKELADVADEERAAKDNVPPVLTSSALYDGMMDNISDLTSASETAGNLVTACGEHDDFDYSRCKIGIADVMHLIHRVIER